MVIIKGQFCLFLHKTICCGYSLESPCRGDSNEYPQYMFLWRIDENYPSIVIKYPLYLVFWNRYIRVLSVCVYRLDMRLISLTWYQCSIAQPPSHFPR